MTLATDAPIVQTITTNTGIDAIPVNGLGNIGLFMTLAGVTSGQFTFEASIDSTDGVNGNWFVIPGMRTNGVQVESATGALSATPAYGWQFDVTCFNYFRVRATAGTFGTATTYMAPGQNPKLFMTAPAANASAAAGASSMFVQGAAVRNSTAPGNPIIMGATGRATNLAAITEGRSVDLWADLNGKLIVKPYAPNELDWQATMASDGATITTATTTTLIAAVATYRRYVTAMQLHNAGTTATEVVLQDTTGTPVVLWRGYLPASMTNADYIVFPTPLRTGSGTASGLSLRTITAGAAIRWSLQGFAGY